MGRGAGGVEGRGARAGLPFPCGARMSVVVWCSRGLKSAQKRGKEGEGERERGREGEGEGERERGREEERKRGRERGRGSEGGDCGARKRNKRALHLLKKPLERPDAAVRLGRALCVGPDFKSPRPSKFESELELAPPLPLPPPLKCEAALGGGRGFGGEAFAPAVKPGRSAARRASSAGACAASTPAISAKEGRDSMSLRCVHGKMQPAHTHTHTHKPTHTHTRTHAHAHTRTHTHAHTHTHTHTRTRTHTHAHTHTHTHDCVRDERWSDTIRRQRHAHAHTHARRGVGRWSVGLRGMGWVGVGVGVGLELGEGFGCEVE